MSDIAISVQNLSKRYLIGHESRPGGYKTLRESVSRGVKSMGRKAVAMFRGQQLLAGDEVEEFWALKDVSFEVKRGEVLGVIGRNGAGKSTLLKVLSRITEPTDGRVEIHGRVASLLEVGTGFHPELTGRENIFLNGAILGMSKQEICSKFDEIVAFAEVEKFLDTPVKRYSSGMYVRLAFAVAAHLEPEILIIDEVLAVGDAGFQKKCLGKMGQVAEGGRTVLFVSHQMAALESLCSSAILIVDGRLTLSGGISRVISAYLEKAEGLASLPLISRTDREGSGSIRFTSANFSTQGEVSLENTVVCGRTVVIALRFENNSGGDLRHVSIGIGIDSASGQRILHLYSDLVNQSFDLVPKRAGCFYVKVPNFPLAPGRYGFTLYVGVNGNASDWIKNAGIFDVDPGDFYGTGKLPSLEQGLLLAAHSFCLSENER